MEREWHAVRIVSYALEKGFSGESFPIIIFSGELPDSVYKENEQ